MTMGVTIFTPIFRQMPFNTGTMRKRTILLVMAWLLMAAVVFAQPAKIRRADQYMAAGDFPAAIELYKQVAEKEGLPEAKAALADAYFRAGDLQSAAQWYAVVAGAPESLPEYKYKLGLVLLRLGDCQSAEQWFRDYLRFMPYDPRKLQLLNACAEKERLENKLKGQASVELMPFNTASNDFAPAFYQDGLVFTAEREPVNRTMKERPYGLYKVSMAEKDGELAFSQPEPFAGILNSRFHEGTASFNREQTEIFFTRTRYLESSGKANPLEVSSARRLAQGGWSDLAPLPFCSDDYSVFHPSISADGKCLYFSSNKPGGMGGADLYLSYLENGQWTPAINLGPAINTSGDELFPFISETDKLYFSSNGHFGLGGQDLFCSRQAEDGAWMAPENLGAPLNSESDDIGIILETGEESGYFTSSRPGGIGGDDIYHFRKTGRLAQVDIVGLHSGEPIPGATVVNACTGDTLAADANGRLFLRLPTCCVLNGRAPGYLERSLEACPEEGKPVYDTLFIALALEPEPAPEPEEGEAAAGVPEEPAAEQPMLRGVVFNESTGLPVINAQLKLFATNCSDPTIVATDKNGRFAIPLEQGCCYQVRAERDNFFSRNLEKKICTGPDGNHDQPLNIFLTPYAADPGSEGEGLPVSAAPREESFGFQKSRRAAEDTSFAFVINVYYDLGRTSVREESVPELFKLLHLLQENPQIVLEISSHTDSRGSDNYNQQLSQRRADAIVRYLAGKGIQRQRLIPIGYGESRLANGCTDDTPCTEEEHQENRRTEFRVVGKLN